MSDKLRIVSWFSCGTSSAVNTKLVLNRYRDTHEIIIARCIVPEEHPDNDRFAEDCEKWFGQPVINLRSTEYDSCEDVWTHRKFMSGPHGAVCTVEMKKAVRHDFERSWQPNLQAFGYSADEARRAAVFRLQNPDVQLITLLIECGLNKELCHAIINRAGIVLPTMYRLGFNNANCRGCVRGQTPAYWNLTRLHFPDVFAARAVLSRKIGAKLVKLATGSRIYLDELDPNESGGKEPDMECGLLCLMAEGETS